MSVVTKTNPGGGMTGKPMGSMGHVSMAPRVNTAPSMSARPQAGRGVSRVIKSARRPMGSRRY